MADVGLVLVDYQLAGPPNAELCRRLLEEPRTSQIPVVLLLGRGMTAPDPGSVPKNIVDYLSKPFTPEQLVSTVERVFEAVRSGIPVRRLQEPREPVYAVRTPLPAEHPQVAAAVSAAALARRDTNRVNGVRTVQQSKARVTVLTGVAATRQRAAQPPRLRHALHAAMTQTPTGVFRVSAGNTPATELYFENGQIVVVATQDANRYSEDVEGIMPPKFSPAILEDAVEEQARSGVPFVLALGSRGLLSKTTAVTVLHRFGQRHFARLWTQTAEALAFHSVGMDALPGFALRLEPRRETVDEWLLGTLRTLQAKDAAAFARQEGYAGTPALGTNGAKALGALGLDEQELAFSQQIDGRRDLSAIARTLGISPEHAFLLLFRFRCLEIMEYRPTGSAFVVTPRTSVRRVLPLHR